jgi:hypothetical protein
MEEQKKLEKLKAWVDQQVDISNKESLDMNDNLPLSQDH